MLSRKKTQGKERKARRERAKQIKSCIVCYGSKMISNEQSSSFCTHGHDHTSHQECDIKTCAVFFSNLIRNGFELEIGVDNEMNEWIVAEFCRIFTDRPKRQELGRQIMISSTVNSVLMSAENIDITSYVLWIQINVIQLFEASAKGKIFADTVLQSKDAVTNYAQLLHFLRKRIPCHCLDAIYKNTRRVAPRTPRCWNRNCGGFTDKKKLLVCTKCVMVQYCSKECQVAAWPEHKDNCRDNAKWVENMEVLLSSLNHDNKTEY